MASTLSGLGCGAPVWLMYKESVTTRLVGEACITYPSQQPRWAVHIHGRWTGGRGSVACEEPAGCVACCNDFSEREGVGLRLRLRPALFISVKKSERLNETAPQMVLRRSEQVDFQPLHKAQSLNAQCKERAVEPSSDPGKVGARVHIQYLCTVHIYEVGISIFPKQRW